MNRGRYSVKAFFAYLNGERKSILFGFVSGSAICALFPLIRVGAQKAECWVWNPDHLDGIAVWSLVVALVASAILLWPGPELLRWGRSWITGVNSGAFVIPLGAVVVARLVSDFVFRPASWLRL